MRAILSLLPKNAKAHAQIQSKLRQFGPADLFRESQEA